MSDQTVIEVEQRGHVKDLWISRPASTNCAESAVLHQPSRRWGSCAVTPRSAASCSPVRRGPTARRVQRRRRSEGGGSWRDGTGKSQGLRLTQLIDGLPHPVHRCRRRRVHAPSAGSSPWPADPRIVAETARISDWHLARAAGAGLGAWGRQRGPARLVGVAQAKDLILTGKVIDGQEASGIGLAEWLVPSATLWTKSCVGRCRRGARPEGVRMTLAHLDKVQDLSKEASLASARQVGQWFFPGPRLEESVKGILERKDDPSAGRDTVSFEDLVAEGAAVPVEGWDFSLVRGTGDRGTATMGLRVPPGGAHSPRHGGNGYRDRRRRGCSPPLRTRLRVLVATESWPPERSSSPGPGARLVGGHVVAVADTPTAGRVADAAFDLVVSRHRRRVPGDEIARVLRPGGHVSVAADRCRDEPCSRPTSTTGQNR